MSSGDRVATTAERLCQAMERAGLKQVDLVTKTGIGKASISQYVSGAYNPKARNLRLLAEVLNVSPAWLDGFDVPIEPDFSPRQIRVNQAKQNAKSISILKVRPAVVRGGVSIVNVCLSNGEDITVAYYLGEEDGYHFLFPAGCAEENTKLIQEQLRLYL